MTSRHQPITRVRTSSRLPDDNSFTSTSASAAQNRATALAELLNPALADDDVQRIAEAVAALIIERVKLDDFPELVRPMDQREAAAWLGVNPSTLSQWTGQDADPVPAFRLGSKPVYIKADLIEWLRKRPYQQSEAA